MSSKGDTPHLDTVLARLAAAQHGVFALWQLLGEGISRHEITHCLQTGGLHRIHQGVYSLTPPKTLRIEGHWMAAVLAHGPEAVLSHAAAGALWNLRRSDATLIDVTVPSTAGRKRRKGIRLHRSKTLTADQRTKQNGIPVTTVARTLIDLADCHDERTAQSATDQAEVLQLLDRNDLEPAIAANPGRRGAAVMRRILETYDVGVNITESELEDEFLRLCDRYSITRPDSQTRIGPGRVDFLWRDAKLVVEVDSWRWHGARSRWEADRRRDIKIQREGLRVARVSYVTMTRDAAGAAEDLLALTGDAEPG